MALVKKLVSTTASSAEAKSSAGATREAEVQRKKARTMAKQQQAVERVGAVAE